MNGGSSVGNGGHHLAEGLGPHIADGVDAGNAGLCGLTGSDIARLIKLQLALKQAGGGLAAHAHKDTVAGTVGLFTCVDVL